MSIWYIYLLLCNITYAFNTHVYIYYTHDMYIKKINFFLFQANLALQKYNAAKEDLSKAIDIKSSDKLLFARGVINLLLQVNGSILFSFYNNH